MRNVRLFSAAMRLCALALSGCSDGDTVSVVNGIEPAVDSGQLAVALTARGPSGSLYRLRQASFQVIRSDFGGFGAFLSSENDPLATTLETTLDVGDYFVDLFSGWFLEKVIDGTATPVAATLLSSPTQFFSIATNQESQVSYRFETNGEIIEFGQGRLIIQIEVDEREGDGDFELGEPFVLEGGVISPESNPFGLGAALFPVTSPLNASLEITSDTGSICVRGEVGLVQNADFSTQWGALFALDFAGTGVPFDFAAAGIAGFAFNVSGPELPPLRAAAQPAASDPSVDNFCRVLDPLAQPQVSVPLNSLDRDCWNGVRAPMEDEVLSNFNWTIPADEFSVHPFDFCVSDLRPLLR